ncbi:MAG: methyltransferase domain-containing protein [Betaproteobacteria bacterium]|nr:methyltransferase domain-containing protein [Betaproteobacteria bacterium]
MPLDPEKSVADHRAIAARYDHSTRRTNGVRLAAIAALGLQPGETVLNVGCGSGFSFAAILAAIGPRGVLLAFDHSEDLLAIARRHIAAAGWNNVVLLQARAERVDFRPEMTRRGIAPPSALLFSYVHDVMQSEGAIDNLLAQAAPRARVAITSTKLWPRAWWPLCLPVNAYLYQTHERYITNRDENFDRPWAKLARHLAPFDVRVRWPGWRYVACGRVKDTLIK